MNLVEWLLYAAACKEQKNSGPYFWLTPAAKIIVAGHTLRGFRYRPGILNAPESAMVRE